MARSPSPTRQRLLAEAMRLFGEKGYAATSVAEIEAAAGLVPGSGSLYKHFRSKEAVLTAGLGLLLESGREFIAGLDQAGVTSPSPAPGEAGSAASPRDDPTLVRLLEAVARNGLARMEQDRDLNRLLFRGLDAFPALMARFRDEEMARVHRSVTAMLERLGGQFQATDDWEAIGAVLVGAIAHYWVLRDLFGEHPSGVDESRYTAAAARLAAAALGRQPHRRGAACGCREPMPPGDIHE